MATKHYASERVFDGIRMVPPERAKTLRRMVEESKAKHVMVVRDYDPVWKDGIVWCEHCSKEVGRYDGEFGSIFDDQWHKSIWMHQPIFEE